MKKLEECRAYFEDVFMDMLDDSEESKQFEMFEETLAFIYGDDYKRIAPHWKQEALNKFYAPKK